MYSAPFNPQRAKTTSHVPLSAAGSGKDNRGWVLSTIPTQREQHCSFTHRQVTLVCTGPSQDEWYCNQLLQQRHTYLYTEFQSGSLFPEFTLLGILKPRLFQSQVMLLAFDEMPSCHWNQDMVSSLMKDITNPLRTCHKIAWPHDLRAKLKDKKHWTFALCLQNSIIPSKILKVHNHQDSRCWRPTRYS